MAKYYILHDYSVKYIVVTVIYENLHLIIIRFYGVTVSTLDFESSDPSSNLGRT